MFTLYRVLCGTARLRCGFKATYARERYGAIKMDHLLDDRSELHEMTHSSYKLPSNVGQQKRPENSDYCGVQTRTLLMLEERLEMQIRKECA
jgi:hypothetical protein